MQATISEQFHPRDNAITPIRLGLALLVVFSHSFRAGGFGYDPLYQLTGGQAQLGSVAVAAFFGLSGFLLLPARRRRGRAVFAWHRFLRIEPALVVCVLATVAFVPWLAGSHVDLMGWAASALRVAVDLPTVPGVFPGVAMPDLVNASLWTLGLEVACYAVLLLAPIRLAAVAMAIMGGTAFGLSIALAESPSILIPQLFVAFAAGALLAHGADRVPLSGRVACLALIATALAGLVGMIAIVMPVAVPYIAVWLSVRLPVRWTIDLSYGTYIYAWPIQQLLAVAGLAALGFGPYLVLVVAATLGIALASARLVEEPALRLKGWRPRPVGTGAVEGISVNS